MEREKENEYLGGTVSDEMRRQVASFRRRKKKLLAHPKIKPRTRTDFANIEMLQQ